MPQSLFTVQAYSLPDLVIYVGIVCQSVHIYREQTRGGFYTYSDASDKALDADTFSRAARLQRSPSPSAYIILDCTSKRRAFLFKTKVIIAHLREAVLHRVRNLKLLLGDQVA